MTFLNLAKQRYSVRSYTAQAVEDEKLNYILESGRVAPSAANFQPWHLVVIRNPEMLEKIAAVYPRDWFKQAPAVIVICGDHTKSWKRFDGKDHCDIDAAIITDHMTLAATEQGLGTCWICNFDAKNCAAILGLPENIEPIVMLTLGYPKDKADVDRHATRRLKTEEFIHFEKFS